MPPHPVTPWGAAADAVMADGAWHTIDDLLDGAGPTIPPGRAWREGERLQARHRSTGTGWSKTSDAARDLRGRRHLLVQVAVQRVRRGRWETRVVDGVREWRRVR